MPPAHADTAEEEDKEEMLAQLDRLIEMAKEGRLEHFREKVMGL